MSDIDGLSLASILNSISITAAWWVIVKIAKRVQ